MPMVGKILVSGWRATLRDPLHSLINLVGLALGFSAAILIALFLRYETSFENFVPDGDRIARLTIALHIPGRGAMAFPQVGPTMARDLLADMPEIETAIRVANDSVGVRRGTFEASEKVFDVDPGFLGFFGLALAAGNAATALDRPDGVVLSQDAARKYFGEQNPLGQTLDIAKGHVMQVTGVLAPVPLNSHLAPNILLPSRAAFTLIGRNDASPDPSLFNFMTYVKLRPGVSVAAIRARLPDFLRRHPPMPADQMANLTPDLGIQPLDDIHLHSFTMGEPKPGSDPQTLWAFAAIGILILLVAAINFVTLLSARASRRALEVGVRKAVGASRRQLVLQFLSETLIQSVAAMVLAVAIAELSLPAVSRFLGRSLGFAYWHDPVIAAALVGMVLVVGLVAGTYPALVLSAFRPGAVLKGDIPGGGRSRLRQILVVMQFAISIGLIVSTLVIAQQTDFARRRSLRLDADPILVIGNLGRPLPRETLTSLRNRIAALPGVRAAAASFVAPTDYSTGYTTADAPGHPHDAPISLFVDAAEPSFFQVYGLRPIAGRVLSPDNPTDDGENSPVVLTLEASRALGFASPQAAIDQPILLGSPQNTKTETIVGVVPDFPIKSVRDRVEPLVFTPGIDSYGALSIKLAAGAVPQTVQAIDRIWAETVADRPITRAFLDDRIEALYRDMTRESHVFVGLAGLSILVGCLGLFGLSAFAAEQRTREIGIRKALGASTGQIVRLLIWDLAKPVLLANLIAWPTAWWAMHWWLEGFAWRIELDATPFLVAGLGAIGLAILTTTAHALQVGRARPVAALRYE